MTRRADTIGSGGCAIFGAALILAGGLFDAAPLLVAGVAFAALGGGSEAWVRRAAAGAGIERHLAMRRVQEEQPLEVRVAARAGRMPFPGGELHDPLLPEPVPLRAGDRDARLRIEVRFERRGARTLAPSTLVLRDPLGIAQRTVIARGPDKLVVLPRTSPVRFGGEGGRGEGMRARLAMLGPGEFDGLRPYRPGTPATRIHWPALARGAGLLERRLREPAERRPLVILDPSDPRTTADLDAAVRAAASLCLALAQAGGCALLLPGDRRPTSIGADLRAWPRAHVRLALVVEGPAPVVGPLGARSPSLVYVAASARPRLPRALARAQGIGILVVPGALPGRHPVLEVAGCNGYELAHTTRRAA